METNYDKLIDDMAPDKNDLRRLYKKERLLMTEEQRMKVRMLIPRETTAIEEIAWTCTHQCLWHHDHDPDVCGTKCKTELETDTERPHFQNGMCKLTKGKCPGKALCETENECQHMHHECLHHEHAGADCSGCGPCECTDYEA